MKTFNAIDKTKAFSICSMSAIAALVVMVTVCGCRADVIQRYDASLVATLVVLSFILYLATTFSFVFIFAMIYNLWNKSRSSTGNTLRYTRRRR